MLRQPVRMFTALQAAHVAAIPFEGLDPYLRRPVALDLATLQEKIFAHRRGGYCLEQNMLFREGLRSLGYKITSLQGRVVRGLERLGYSLPKMQANLR